ncbi:hypothetical protein [Alkalihalobacillus trypoxylicola]|uniref:YqgU-like 6-bladed beta-propeller domain-containing protein n=1 Tax=Alkalihalobacillus trypoxylicola TaxID=519424 RepID=A0A162E9B2_9BACI|nr:hypothetical protein [Alkalihalobacillus trypoxylicola]KYG32092.1 hypothetical protein AZF04_04790 [Alkalihalobacillus trypoxylicola]
MKQKILFFCLPLLLFLWGCQFVSHPSPSIVNEERAQKSKGAEKIDTIIPYSSKSAFLEVLGWFDSETVVIFEEDEKSAKVLKYHIYSGEVVEIFHTDASILEVEWFYSSMILAVQTMDDEAEQADLLFINQMGERLMTLNQFGDQYSVILNPFNKDVLVVVSYLPDWQLESYVINLPKSDITPLHLTEHDYQWLSDGSLTYLTKENEWFSSLHRYTIENNQEQLLNERLIQFFSFSDFVYLGIHADSPQEQTMKYTFYQGEQEISTLDVPILTTHSEEWWIPFFDYNPESKSFYYMKPKYSSDFYHYDDGFELMKYEMNNQSTNKILELEDFVPFQVSPNEEYLLYGQQFHYLYSNEKNEVISLVEGQ